MRSYKRRKFFIEKSLQAKYLLLTIIMLLIYTLLFAAILFTPLIFGFSAAETLDKQTEAARIILTLHQSVWPALGLVIGIMAVISVFITHKIAGPVYRLKKVLGEVAAGNLDRTIVLRKRDDLKDLAEGINTLLGELRSFVQVLQEDRAHLSECVQILEAQIENRQIDAETGRELIEKLQGSSQRATEKLEKYS